MSPCEGVDVDVTGTVAVGGIVNVTVTGRVEVTGKVNVGVLGSVAVSVGVNFEDTVEVVTGVFVVFGGGALGGFFRLFVSGEARTAIANNRASPT